MNYCPNCGYKLPENSKFCQNCGQRVDTETTPIHEITHQTIPQNTYTKSTPKKSKSIARGFLMFATIFCFFGAALLFITSMFTEMNEGPGVPGALIFSVLGLLCFVLYNTPKGSTYIFGKKRGIKRPVFILICICLIFAITILFNYSTQCPHEYILAEKASATCTKEGKEKYVCSLCNREKFETIKATGHKITNGKCTSCGFEETKTQTTQKTTLDDVLQWYENSTPGVSQSLINMATSIDGLTVVNVDSSKFHFGENFGYYNCHYTLVFTCKINGVSYMGEARGFLKYQDSKIHWFHFEIFSNTGITSLVEHYDDSYDKIIEDYYKELIAQYN